jgi:hypothetical protein
MPSLIVDPTNQFRQLSAQMSSFVDAQPVAEGVEYGA